MTNIAPTLSLSTGTNTNLAIGQAKQIADGHDNHALHIGSVQRVHQKDRISVGEQTDSIA